MDPRRSTRLSKRLERAKKPGRSSGRIKAVTPPPDGEGEDFRAMVPDLAAPDADEVRAEVRSLRQLHEVIHFLGGAPDLHALQGEIIDLALSVSDLRRGMLALRSPTDDDPEGAEPRFKIKASRGFEDDAVRAAPETRVLRGILNRALDARESLIEGDVLDGGILGHAKGQDLSLGAVACLPLESGGVLLGAFLLDDPDRRTPFTLAEASLLRSFARHAALALARVAEHGALRRRTTSLMRRTERLEAERDAALKHAQGASRAQARIARDGLEALSELPYADAKSRFTSRYLEDAIKRAGGDLRIASKATGLPLARLIGLMTHLDIQVEGRSSEGTWGEAARRTP